MKLINRVSIIFISTLFFLFLSIDSAAEWSSVYHRRMKPSDITAMRNKRAFTFIKQETKPFTQVIFAWNGVCPEKGFFSFYIQVRNADNNKWGAWHHMADWGKKTKKSFMSKSDGVSSYHYVTLEMENDKQGDGFKIKAVPLKGARLKDIEALTVTIVNHDLFSPENIYITGRYMAETVHLSDVPYYSQLDIDHDDKDRMCSPTSCAMIIDFIRGEKIKEPKKVAKKVFDEGLKAYGSWHFNTNYTYECCNKKYWIFPTRLNSFLQLYHQLKRGLPVVVSVQGLLEGERDKDKDHVVVVVGYDAQTKEVIVHDPAIPLKAEKEMRYPLKDFIRAWEESDRLSYWLEHKNIKERDA